MGISILFSIFGNNFEYLIEDFDTTTEIVFVNYTFNDI